MTQPKAAGSCPMCKEKASETYRPFCSRRCADLDLARWLKGQYAIPGRHAAPEEMEQADPANPDAATRDPDYNDR